MKKHILILCPYPYGQAPSQRFRFEQYLNFLEQEGLEINQQSFLDEKTWGILYKSGNQLHKIKGILKGGVKRFLLLFSVFQYDFVFIHREATPLGPPIIEWVIAKVFRKKIIYDFDDAIWLPNTSQENKIAAALKYHSKVRSICKWSFLVTCGNSYLAGYARQFNKNVKVVPTTIDTKYHKKQGGRNNRFKSTCVIGWTGTHSTEKYLEEIIPVLQELEKDYSFVFRVISNHNPKLSLKSFEYTQWDKATEISDLLQFDIGVMPLENNEWTLGKCGFKGLQYMALGIPTIMSPVGVNKDIILQGENGFLASSPKEWKVVLSQLMEDEMLRMEIGGRGVGTIAKYYSVEANEKVYLSLFQ